MRMLLASLLVGAVAVAGALLPSPPASTPVAVEQTAEIVVPAAPAPRAKPLAGKVIVLDPGHQLGNRNFPAEINRPVSAGGFTKPCNTTGTATNAGFPEATFAWRTAKELRKRLKKLGAKVKLTRKSNSDRLWGPCVDVRGRAGNKAGADLLISIHGDGSLASGARGFHVIAPGDLEPWTSDIHKPSLKLAKRIRRGLTRAGVPRANYIAANGLDVRTDLGTLNLSDVPAVMVELGNMRSPVDARRMTSKKGRRPYVRGLVRGVRDFLG